MTRARRPTRRLASARTGRREAAVRGRRARERSDALEAERWSRDHIGDADDVGTKRLLDAQEQARQIIEQARIEARRIRAEPQPDEAPATSAQTETTAERSDDRSATASRSSSVPSS